MASATMQEVAAVYRLPHKLNIIREININNYLPKPGFTSGFKADNPVTLLPLPPLVGVTDFEIGVVGFSSIFLAEGVLAFDEVPLLGLIKQNKFFISYSSVTAEYSQKSP